MSRKKDPELVTSKKMAEMMSALYPVRAKRNGFPRFLRIREVTEGG